MSNFQAFKVGCLLGIIYGLFRHPCALGCLMLLVLLAGVVALVVIYQHAIAVSLVVVVVLLLRWGYRTLREKQDTDTRDERA